MNARNVPSWTVFFWISLLPAVSPIARAQERTCGDPILPNLIRDWNFECGPGAGTFFTDYFLGGDDLGPGWYDVRLFPENWNPLFDSCRDHTNPPNPQYMMVVDGTNDNNAAIWAQEFNVRPNTAYVIRYWIMTLDFIQGPTIITRIRRELPAPVIYLPDLSREQYSYQHCTWQLREIPWFSGDCTRITLILMDDEGAASGNDFALDDIEFKGQFHYGDINCDGVVDGSDINAYLFALFNPVMYPTTYLGCDIRSADFNGDGIVSFADLPGLITCILNGGC